MGNKKKFDKIQRNETYYETHLEESESSKPEKKEKTKEKKVLFSGLIPGEVPEKKKPSTRFTYTREKRKVMNDSGENTVVDAPSKAPYVCALIVLCAVFVMRSIAQSDIFFSLSESIQAVVKTGMYVVAYIVPSVVFVTVLKTQRHLHNIRRFSMNILPFSASCLGLMLCLTALQKYLIAYAFSYSEPVVAVHGGVGLSIVVGALLPAICEEFFIRGILQYEISEYAGGFCGVLVSAFVFAMLHFELQYFFVYFVAGILLGSITHVSRSVFPSMIIHFLNNTLSIMFSDKLSFVATERIGGTLLIIVLASVCFGFLILTLHLAEKISQKRALKFLEQGSCDSENEKNVFFVLSPDKKSGIRFFKVITTPAMLVSFAVFIIVAFTGI